MGNVFEILTSMSLITRLVFDLPRVQLLSDCFFFFLN